MDIEQIRRFKTLCESRQELVSKWGRVWDAALAFCALNTPISFRKESGQSVSQSELDALEDARRVYAVVKQILDAECHRLGISIPKFTHIELCRLCD